MKDVLHYVKRLADYSGFKLYLNLIGMALIGLLDGLGMLLLIPMLNMSGIAAEAGTMHPVTKALSFVRDYPAAEGLLIVLAIYLTVSIAQFVMQRALTVQNINMHQNFVHDLRMTLYRGLLAAGWEFYLNRRKSDIISSLTTEMGRVNSGVHLFMSALTSGIFTVIQIGLAVWLSPVITAYVVGSGLALGLFARRFSRKATVLGNHTVETSQRHLAGITDLFGGIKEVKSNRLERSRLAWVQQLSARLRYEQEEFTRIRTASQLLYKIASSVLIAAFLYLSVVLFRTQPGQMVVIIVIFSRLWPRFISGQANMEQVASFIPAFRNLRALEQESAAAAEQGNNLREEEDVTERLRMERGIVCRDLDYRYGGEESAYALRNVNLTIPAGRMTAIVGRSGAGKSTLVDLVMGLVKPQRGQVLVDGSPVTGALLESLRQSLSYVPQDPFLFHATIRENLLLVEPKATEAQLWEALEASSAAEFVRRLPAGLDTLIGDRGVKLSGGERQRLVLGRALLRKPSILVLDEATSALDRENETNIQQALEQLRGRTTILVIAHRLSTIRNADQVVVLERGQIVQQGEYGRLAGERGGVFRQLLGASREQGGDFSGGERYDWGPN
ncbi:ABC transporter ATP-binding protein [Paenibacillus aurantiacus]|uniref:ABC transporter ATP-binding protein n=1 Tax=Paenibacillus aurantiacus TaxID=1936118 RepID=A0ABV5KIJ1_9BACL